MSQVDVPEYALVKVDQVEQTIRSGRSFRAFERSATVLAFGTMIYAGFLGYSVISDMTAKIKEMQYDLVEGQDVHPTVFSDEGYAELIAYHKGKRGVFKGWNIWKFMEHYKAAKAMYEETGVVKALPWTVDMVDHWEAILIRRGLIMPGEAVASAKGGVHPVDKVVGKVLNNSATYWGVVLGLTVVPALPVVASIIKEAKTGG